jgi:hypothetical protein
LLHLLLHLLNLILLLLQERLLHLLRQLLLLLLRWLHRSQAGTHLPVHGTARLCCCI